MLRREPSPESRAESVSEYKPRIYAICLSGKQVYLAPTGDPFARKSLYHSGQGSD
jgi:hypothetical protein